MYDLKTAGSKKTKIMKPLNDNMAEISYFDVKELYEIAFAAEAKDEDKNVICLLMSKAQKLDDAYRAQLNAGNTMRYFKAA